MQRQKLSTEKCHANKFFSLRKIVMPLAVVVALSLPSTQMLCAQTYSVLHSFTAGSDGAAPFSGVTIDGADNLYGTTTGGGTGHGTVYELKLRNGNYTLNPLYLFPGGAGGSVPYSRVVFGPHGLLYGTTTGGGNGNGVVFDLQPHATACASPLCSWMETVLFAFPANGRGGSEPAVGDPVFDAAGNMYDSTNHGGTDNDGVVFELTPGAGMWTETVLASFTGPNGQFPGHYADGGVILDSSGNLYGTTFNGGTSGEGVAYQLVKSSGFMEMELHNFTAGADGTNPDSGLVFDAAGNLYGTTSEGGSGGGGTIFELSPPGTWTTLTTIYSFSGSGGCANDTGPGPLESLTIDSAGNLYGTTCADGAHHRGNVFELSPVNGGWTYADIYDFTGGTDGANPISNAICDSAGNLYGTTSQGGAHGYGVVWKISGVGCLPTQN